MIQPARFALVAALVLAAACGKKGPPLAPLHLVPGPATDVSIRRLGPDAQMQFVIPATNVNGPGRAEIDRVEVYAVTVAPGSAPPPNRDLLSSKYLVGSIPVKPPPVEDETAPENVPPDARPSPGEGATFVEALTAEKLKPVTFAALAVARPAPVPPAAAGTAVPAAGATGTVPATPSAAGAATPPAVAGTVPPAAVATAPAAGTSPSAATAPGTVPSATPQAAAVPPSAAAGTTPPAAGAPGAAATPGAAGGTTPASASAPGMTSPAAAAAVPQAVPAVPVPTYPVRVYVLRGMTKRGRAGQPSARVQLPIIPPPSPPSGLNTTLTENAVVLKWTPPPRPALDIAVVLPGSIVPIPAVAAPVVTVPVRRAPRSRATTPAVAAALPTASTPSQLPAVDPTIVPPPLSFNVYKPDSTTPLNGEPIAGAEYERTGVVFGTEQCFTVRAIEKVAAISIESVPSEPYCVTPRDTFPPAQPKGLAVVAGTGTINLSWDANTEADLAGYLVLRGEAPGGTLQPLTPVPITGTSFEDKTVRPGVRYAYAIVAVDKTAPANRSEPSARVEETAR